MNNISISMTSFAARNELSDISSEIDNLVRSNCLAIKSVRVRTVEHQKYNALIRNGVHKGEAEAIAWIVSQPKGQRPAFVSNDRGARNAALQQHLEAGDVMDLLVCLVRLGSLTQQETEKLTTQWSEHVNAFCRPTDYKDFYTTFQARSDPQISCPQI
ncbi:MAG: hypothetical protein H7839_09775 [Magnetococcus sp. YQC-5]